MITAPYNFVPLNKEVFYPTWSEQVNHDIPFEDGESGEIDITITAKSPIFIRNHSDDKGENFCQKNPKLCNSFEPLGIGSTFSGKIRFHNLNPIELGDLISALNFIDQNKDDKYFHKVGMAKAYGFGTVSIQINSLKTVSNKGIDSFMNSFKNHLNQELKIDLLQHPRIKAFLKLSSYSFEDKELQVMEIKDFVNAKRDVNKFCLSEVVENGYDKSKFCKPQDTQIKSQNKQQVTKKSSSSDLTNFFNNR